MTRLLIMLCVLLLCMRLIMLWYIYYYYLFNVAQRNCSTENAEPAL